MKQHYPKIKLDMSASRTSTRRDRLRTTWPKLLMLIVLLLLAACVDKDKAAVAKAGPLLERLLPIVERDYKQIRDGMPKGAIRLAQLIEEKPAENLVGLRRAITTARSNIHELAVAKSTFFMFVDPKGRVLRSEAEPDLAATHSLTDAIPETKSLFKADAGVVETYGYMKGLRGVEKGGDHQWVLGVPVVAPNGELSGSFVTGWSFRRYAYYLEEDTRRYINAKAEKDKAALALVYIFLVKGKKAYGAAVTPEVNTKAVSDLDIVGKFAKSPVFTSFVDVERRRFVVHAKPLPLMGSDAALAVMLSEI